MMKLGISSFVETTYDTLEQKLVTHDERIREVIEEIVLADTLGLDIFGVGEHHREDFAASSPAVILAAAAALTQKIRLTSAVSIISSDDPVRLYQDFSTIDAISKGRAEIMAGRGSFTESFPLFGYSLENYDQLFSEKLDLLLKLCQNEPVTWKGNFRAPLVNQSVYPRSVQNPLPVTLASGGNVESAMRAGTLGLPLVLAIIGGNFEYFSYAVSAYYHAGREAGHDPSKLSVSVHSHGYVADSNEQAAEEFYPSTAAVMSLLGKERGWPPYTRKTFDLAREKDGALFVGDADYVTNKIMHLHDVLGIDQFMIHLPLGSMPHAKVMHSIRLFANEVAPKVRELTK